MKRQFLSFIYINAVEVTRSNIYLQETEQEKTDKGYVLKTFNWRERRHSLLKYIDKYQRWHTSDRIYMIFFFFVGGGGRCFVFWSKRLIILYVHTFQHWHIINPKFNEAKCICPQYGPDASCIWEILSFNHNHKLFRSITCN